MSIDWIAGISLFLLGAAAGSYAHGWWVGRRLRPIVDEAERDLLMKIQLRNFGPGIGEDQKPGRGLQRRDGRRER